MTVSEEEHATSPIASEEAWGEGHSTVNKMETYTMSWCDLPDILLFWGMGYVFISTKGQVSSCLSFLMRIFWTPSLTRQRMKQITSRILCLSRSNTQVFKLSALKWSKCGGRIINIEDSVGKCWQQEKGTLASFGTGFREQNPDGGNND